MKKVETGDGVKNLNCTNRVRIAAVYKQYIICNKKVTSTGDNSYSSVQSMTPVYDII